MYKVAFSVLREGGIADQAEDVVHDAMTSLISSPPTGVRSWEAMMVVAAKRKALDRLRSAPFRHAGPELSDDHDRANERDEIEEAAEALDRQREGARAWDALAVLDPRHRLVAREYIVHGRSREEVAAELGVTPARVSQMAKLALEQLREELDR